MAAFRAAAEALELDIPGFRAAPDDRPLGSGQTMVAMGVVYLASLTALKFAAAGRAGSLGGIVRALSLVNNVVMCLYSLYTFVGVSCVLIANTIDSGFSVTAALCDPARPFMKGMDYWAYHFYLSKFWEWIDTWILILRGKGVWPPTNSQYFLHVFHHTTTASIAWMAWRQQFNIAWIGPLTNSFVHTPMYAYYFVTDFWKGARKFGIFITPIQILQFIVCLSCMVPESLYPTSCDSNKGTLAWMWFTYLTFLGFFLKMFMDKKKARREAKKAASAVKGRAAPAPAGNAKKDKLG